ncbi:unannotated protein [freshwater metagenome]|uniref:Unannotated protein n=1 Tax=freshwater metagenome TaxID=449393 RepID=A0A6J7I4Z1_9ZZZZ
MSHGSIGAGAVQHVRYRFLFSATAPISLQGVSSSISATVSNTVVGGTDRTGG